MIVTFFQCLIFVQLQLFKVSFFFCTVAFIIAFYFAYELGQKKFLSFTYLLVVMCKMVVGSESEECIGICYTQVFPRKRIRVDFKSNCNCFRL